MRTIVAGNWKMHKDRSGAEALVRALLDSKATMPGKVEVIIAPPFPFLTMAVELTKGSGIEVAAQNCHEAEQGAYTGEVSAGMLASIGVSACLVAHSERRQYFGETDATAAAKINALLAVGITPIYCCGERKEEREAGRHFEVVSSQMKAALSSLSTTELQRVVVAYEPVWAIGTGLTATAQQAQDMHAHIRGLLRTHGETVASNVPVLYGGSCKPDNAAELFAGADVNGGLIGGAALDAEQFLGIIAHAG
ncbi:MAG: triose-phosphate isomerase [Flavobacteriales bacterium]